MAMFKLKPVAQKLIYCTFFVLCMSILLVECSYYQEYERSSYEEDYNAGPSIHAVTPQGNVTEGPHWDSNNNYLYYVDVYGQTFNRYDPKTGRVTSTYLGGVVSACIPIKDECRCGPDSFVCGINRDLVLIRWDGISSEPSYVKILQSVEQDKPYNSFGDAKADGKGTLWIGSFAYLPTLNVSIPQANLYHYSIDKCRLEKDLTQVSSSQGPAWNKDYTKMYYIDSLKRQVYSFDYDIETSSIRNQRTVFDFLEYQVPGNPDGFTVDGDDNIWIGCQVGARVIKIDPRRRTGKLLFTIIFPVYQVFSVTFGGPNLDVLYVTTGTFSLNAQQSAEQRALQPLTGSIFAVYGLKARGRPANEAFICCGGHAPLMEE